MADSEPDHFGTNEMVDINKCSFGLVSSAFDFKRSAWRLDFCIVPTILTNVILNLEF
jgi:hypothetical protein